MQARLDAALGRVATGSLAAHGLTVEAGWPDTGVAEARDGHIVVHAGWVDRQSNDALDTLIRHEAGVIAASRRFRAVRTARTIN